jgi:hypothetical protein
MHNTRLGHGYWCSTDASHEGDTTTVDVALLLVDSYTKYCIKILAYMAGSSSLSSRPFLHCLPFFPLAFPFHLFFRLAFIALPCEPPSKTLLCHTSKNISLNILELISWVWITYCCVHPFIMQLCPWIWPALNLQFARRQSTLCQTDQQWWILDGCKSCALTSSHWK